jgi:hypothetical protein
MEVLITPLWQMLILVQIFEWVVMLVIIYYQDNKSIGQLTFNSNSIASRHREQKLKTYFIIIAGSVYILESIIEGILHYGGYSIASD